MAKGIIKQLMSETTTGLIREVGNERDIFFQAGSLLGSTYDRLFTGQPVEFEHKSYSSKEPEKTRAINVRPLSA